MNMTTVLGVLLDSFPYEYTLCMNHLCVTLMLLSQFLSEVEAWCKVCSEGGLPSEMQELELAIHRHQSLYEQVTQAYTEVNQQHSKHHTSSASNWNVLTANCHYFYWNQNVPLETMSVV